MSSLNYTFIFGCHNMIYGNMNQWEYLNKNSINDYKIFVWTWLDCQSNSYIKNKNQSKICKQNQIVKLSQHPIDSCTTLFPGKNFDMLFSQVLYSSYCFYCWRLILPHIWLVILCTPKRHAIFDWSLIGNTY